MTVAFRITSRLAKAIRSDLARPHEFAAERVGFISCGVTPLAEGGILVLAREYHAVGDADYLDDPTVGAMVGAGGFRKALEAAYRDRVSMWHVHCHAHRGAPRFSETDLSENSRFVPDFWHVRPEMPHGALLLSHDGIAGLCWVPGRTGPVRVGASTFVGAPMLFTRGLDR